MVVICGIGGGVPDGWRLADFLVLGCFERRKEDD